MITTINYVLADGNAWTEDSDSDLDMEASLSRLRHLTAVALMAAYPQAAVYCRRENASGAVRAVRAFHNDGDGEEPVSDGEAEEIAAVADAVWEAGDWYRKAGIE